MQTFSQEHTVKNNICFWWLCLYLDTNGFECLEVHKSLENFVCFMIRMIQPVAPFTNKD